MGEVGAQVAAATDVVAGSSTTRATEDAPAVDVTEEACMQIESKLDNLTPRVFEAVVSASLIGDEEYEEGTRPLLSLSIVETGSWEEVRKAISKLSTPDIQEMLRSRKQQIPTGKERRIDACLEFFKNVARQKHRDIAAALRRAEAERQLNERKENSAIMIQCLARCYIAYKDFKQRLQLAREAAERARIAAETAENWRRAQQPLNTAVVWLHGQGETEVGWQEVFADFVAPESCGHCRWLWPRAEVSPCTSRGGTPTAQWFDTPEFPVCRIIRGKPDRTRKQEDPEQIRLAIMKVNAVIDALEAEGIPTDRIALGVFGQGAALVVHSVLRSPKPLAGGAMLGGYVPCLDAIEEHITSNGRKAKLLWLHGARDMVVHPEIAMFQQTKLKKLGVSVDFRLNPELGFNVSPSAVAVLQAFLCQRLDAACSDQPEEDSSANDSDGEGAASNASRNSTDKLRSDEVAHNVVDEGIG